MLLSLLLSLFLLFSSRFAQAKDYEVKVKTADKFRAGTDAPVSIEVKGTLGSLGKRELDKRDHDDFERGSLDTYYFSDWDIGYVTGLTVHLGSGGWYPGWNLDYILIRIAGAKDAVFNYGGKEIKANSQVTLTLSCNDGNVVNSQGYCDALDVDECLNPISCIEPAICENTVGSYKCNCPSGYIKKPGTNNQCQDVNECLNPIACFEPATCENTWGSYKCNCPSGWVQKPGTNNQCQDIDECSKGYCDLLRSTCVNLYGSYRCDCKSGYENNTPKSCININECTKGIDSCNKTSSYCLDTDGDFWCRCKTGYNQGANNKLCVAVPSQ